MEFIAFLKIGLAMSVSLIVGVLLTAYAGICLVATVSSLIFWDTCATFKNQNWGLRAIWLMFLLPFSLALFFFIAPHARDFVRFIWSFV